MMSKGHKFLAILYATIAILIAGASTYFVSDYMYNNELGFPSEVEFVLDEEVDLVVGEKYQLTPYIINEDEDIEYGQYLYSSDSSCVTVSDTGLINVLSLPEKEVLITVTELSRNLSKTVKLNITRGINGVFNIETSASEMLYNAIYEYKVTFLPQDADITDFVSFQTTDSKGNVIDEVFELEVLGNVLKFKTNGLGKGKLSINIKSEKDLVNYTKEFDFNISLEDTILSNDITKDSLLGVNELAQIDTLYFTGDVLDVSDLSLLPNLKDVALTNSSNVCLCENLSQKYKYHVKENLYSSYYEQINLGDDFFKYVEPYNTSILTDKFVIYYDTRSDEVSCSQVLDFFKFNKLEEVGYKHIGWSLERNNETKILNESDVYNSNANSIVVYSMFKPIEYVMSFNSTMLDTNKFLENVDYTYKDEVVVRLSDGFKNYIESVKESVPGYKFVGWSSRVKESKILRPEDFGDLIDFNLLESNIINLDKPLTDTDGTVITYYDVWQPITYNVTFDISEYSNEFIKVNDGLNSAYYYDDLVDITGFEVMGYNLLGWNHKGTTITKINELTSVEGETVILTPVLEAKEYTVWIKVPKVDSNGKRILSLTSVFDNFVGNIKYNQDFNSFVGWYEADSNGKKTGTTPIASGLILPIENGYGYEDYKWYIDSQTGNIDVLDNSYDPVCHSSEEGDFKKSLTLEEFTGPSIEGKAEVLNQHDKNNPLCVRLNGVDGTFKIEFDFDGGVAIKDGRQLTIESGEYTSSDTLYIDYVIRPGYKHTGWSVYVNNELKLELNTKDISLNKCKISDSLVLYNKDNVRIVSKFEFETFTVSFNLNGGTGSSSNMTVTYLGTYSMLDNVAIPTQEHHDFMGWYLGDTHITSSSKVTATEDHVLVAKWREQHQITVSESGVDVTLKNADTNEEIEHGAYVSVGTRVKVTFKAQAGKNTPQCYVDGTEISSGYTFTMGEEKVEITTSSKCFAAGTKIMMADGSYKNVEDIKIGDMIATWNFFEGRFEAQPVALYWDHGEDMVDVIKLTFSNGDVVEIIGSHGFYDLDSKEFVQINYLNYQDLVGHRFATIDVNGVTNEATLLNAEIITKTIGTYSLLSAFNGNAIAYNMLTITFEDFEGIYSLKFEVDDNMKFKAENIEYYIDLYGLYTYEEWSKYLTVEQFYALNGQYYKILVGRGFMKEKDIYKLIEGLAKI